MRIWAYGHVREIYLVEYISLPTSFPTSHFRLPTWDGNLGVGSLENAISYLLVPQNYTSKITHQTSKIHTEEGTAKGAKGREGFYKNGNRSSVNNLKLNIKN